MAAEDQDRTTITTTGMRPLARVATPSPAPDPAPGPVDPDTRYEVQERLGESEVAEVLLARDRLLQRAVAIKRLRPDAAPEHVERLRREALALATICSPHVVTLYDLDDRAARPRLIMQYVRGRTVRDDVERRGASPPDRICRLAIGVLEALGAMHVAGLVHRDIKPSNVMIDTDDEAVVLDLGIAHHRRRKSLTPDGFALGTPQYMAPEHLAGVSNVRGDLFQAALLVAFLATGVPIDVSAGTLQLSVLARLPEALVGVVTRGLAGARGYETAAEMLDDLRAVAAGL